MVIGEEEEEVSVNLLPDFLDRDSLSELFLGLDDFSLEFDVVGLQVLVVELQSLVFLLQVLDFLLVLLDHILVFGLDGLQLHFQFLVLFRVDVLHFGGRL